MALKWLVHLWVLGLSLATGCGISPEVVFFNPPQAPRGAKIQLEGSGFTGATAVNLLTRTNLETYGAAFRVLSDEVIELTLSTFRFDDLQEIAAWVRTPAGVTITLPSEITKFNGANATPSARSLCVVSAGATIPEWTAQGCTVFLEPGATISRVTASGCTFFVSSGATLNVGSTISQVYATTNSIVTGGNPTLVPTISASYVPLLLKYGTPPPTYSLLKSVSGNGEVTISPKQSVYFAGQPVQVTATPGPGSALLEWSGPVSGRSQKSSFVLNGNVTVGATFVPGANLWVSAQHGQVQISPQMDIYPIGTLVTATYSPKRGYEFKGWGGDVSSMENPLSFVVTESIEVIAETKEAAFGKLLWSFGDFLPKLPYPPSVGAVWSTPAIGDDGTIYVGFHTRSETSVGDAKVFAIFPDGTQRWARPLVIESKDFRGVRRPVIGEDGTIYVVAGSLLTAFSTEGETIWTKSFGAPGDRSGYLSEPAIGPEGNIYVARMDGRLFAISPDQETLWHYDSGDQLEYSPSVMADGTILLALSFGPVHAFNPDGTLRWIGAGGWVATQIAISATGNLAFGVMFPATGRVLHLDSNGQELRGDSTYSRSSEIVLGTDGRTYFNTREVGIVSINPSGQILWNRRPDDGHNSFATPILGNDGTVYFTASLAATNRFIAYNPDGSVSWENYALMDNAEPWFDSVNLALDRNGVLYGGARTGKLYAVQATGRLAPGAWPKPGADYRNTSRQAPMSPPTTPVLTVAPQSTDVVAGQILNLSARASGGGDLSYQWFANGQAVAGATSPILAIRNVKASHAGDYFVRISNEIGTIDSAPVSVDVLLTIDAKATIGGSVTVQPIQETYEVGSSVTITASAAENYEFTGWTGDAEGTQNPLTVTMNSSKTVTANFVPTYVLTLTPIGPGNIVAEPQKAHYRSGQIVTLTAAPQDGYGFASWGGAITGTTATNTVVMDGDKTVTATFTPLRTLNAQAQTGGSVTISPNQTTFLNGSQATLAAVREPGYDFKGWTGDVESTANPLVITMDRNISVQATFGPAQPPVVTFDVVSDSTVTGSQFVISGAIADNDTIVSASWEREGQAMGELTLADGKFSIPTLTLVEGVNRFRVITTDSVGNETVAEYVITWAPSQRLVVAVPEEVTEGRLITVPIRLTSTGDVSGTAFTVNYDPEYFRVEGFYFEPEFASPFNQVNHAVLGSIRASLASLDTLPAGTVDLGHALLRVRSAPDNLDTVLELAEVSTANALGDSLNDSTGIQHGLIHLLKRAYTGDINANGRLDVGDASLIQRLVIGIEPPRAWDISANDLNGNTTLDVGDVQRALSTAAGIFPQPGGAQPAAFKRAIVAALPAESIRLVSERRTAAPGEEWVVRVVVDNFSGPLAGASFTLDYPKDALRLVNSSSHTVGELLPAAAFATVWNVSPARNDYAVQTGHISMATSSASPNAATEGVLAEFRFQVQPGAAAQSSWTLTLHNLDLTSDGFDVRSLPATQIVFNGWAVRYADWQDAAFRGAPSGNVGDSAPDADPDHDGISNRMEYQFGSNPLAANAGAFVQSSIQTDDGQEFLTVTYHRRRDAADTAARVEVSNDLKTWFHNEDGTGKAYTLETSATDNGNGTESVVIRVLNSSGFGGQTFVRINFVES